VKREMEVSAKFAAGFLIVLITVSALALSGILSVDAPPAEIIVDNPAAAYLGTWPTSTAIVGYYGSNYQSHATGTGANTATWSFSIPSAGNWQVYAIWTSGTNRATNAKYTVNYQDSSTVVTVNQQVNGGSWQSLGTFAFNAAAYSVRLTDNANGYVIADAIRIAPISIIRPRTNITVPASAFVSPRSDDYVQYDTTFGLLNRAGHILSVCQAPLQLPQGATITRVIFYYTDSDSDYFQFGLTRATQDGTVTSLVPLSPIGSATPGKTHVTLTTSATVDNSKYYYYLRIRFPYSTISVYNYCFQYAVVEYEVPP